jgi:hypothetical protein
MECGAIVSHLEYMVGEWTFEGLRFLLIGISCGIVVCWMSKDKDGPC